MSAISPRDHLLHLAAAFPQGEKVLIRNVNEETPFEVKREGFQGFIDGIKRIFSRLGHKERYDVVANMQVLKNLFSNCQVQSKKDADQLNEFAKNLTNLKKHVIGQLSDADPRKRELQNITFTTFTFAIPSEKVEKPPEASPKTPPLAKPVEVPEDNKEFKANLFKGVEALVNELGGIKPTEENRDAIYKTTVALNALRLEIGNDTRLDETEKEVLDFQIKHSAKLGAKLLDEIDKLKEPPREEPIVQQAPHSQYAQKIVNITHNYAEKETPCTSSASKAYAIGTLLLPAAYAWASGVTSVPTLIASAILPVIVNLGMESALPAAVKSAVGREGVSTLSAITTALLMNYGQSVGDSFAYNVSTNPQALPLQSNVTQIENVTLPYQQVSEIVPIPILPVQNITEQAPVIANTTQYTAPPEPAVFQNITQSAPPPQPANVSNSVEPSAELPPQQVFKPEAIIADEPKIDNSGWGWVAKTITGISNGYLRARAMQQQVVIQTTANPNPQYIEINQKTK